MKTIITNPIYGEVSPRLAHNVLADPQLKYGLRTAYNIMISRNMEMTSRPPTHDQGAMDDSGGSTLRSFQFRHEDGTFIILTFSNLKLSGVKEDGTAAFTTFTTTWTSADIALMDGARNEQFMIFVTPGKEPMLLKEVTGTFTWTTVQSEKTGDDDPAWHSTSDWPISVTFMIGRFLLLSPRHYYGSVAGDSLNWDLTTVTIDGDDVVTPSSAFSYNAADDIDSGFQWIRGGSLAFGGSPAGTWMMSNLEAPLNTQNPNIKNYSSIGTYNVPAADISGGFVYFCNDGVTARIFAVGPNGPINTIVNPYAKHFFEESKPKRMVFQRTPDTILWILLENGTMVTFAMDDTRRAWTRFVTDGFINDIWLCKDNTHEYLYMDVERGSDRRMERIENIDPIAEVFIADGLFSFTADPAKEIESHTAYNGDPDPVATYTITAHGFSEDQMLKIIGIEDEDFAIAKGVTTNTFRLIRTDGTSFRMSLGDDFSVRDVLETVTIPHYANKTVDVYADGYFSIKDVDAAGLIVFDAPGSVVILGLPYQCYIAPRSFVDIQEEFIASVNRINPRVYKTRSILYGNDSEHLNEKHLITPEGDSFSGSVQDLPIKGGMNHECTFYVGGQRTPFIMTSCIIDIEVGAN